MIILYRFVIIIELFLFTAGVHFRNKRGIAKACRYTNVPWSDCDASSWMRTKTVKLISQEQFSNGENCPETREFSQTCSRDELPKGTKILLEERRKLKLKENFCHMKMRETKTFLEETQIALRKINQLYKKSKSLSLQRYHNYAKIKTKIEKFDIFNQEYTTFKEEFQLLSKKLGVTEERFSSLELENQHLQEQINKGKNEDNTCRLEKENLWQHLNSSEVEIKRLSKKVSDLENSYGQYKEKVRSALQKRNKESHGTMVTTERTTQQGKYKLSEMTKCKQEVNKFKEESSIVNNEKIQFENKLKDIQENYSKLQDKMKYFLINKTEPKGENVQKPRDDLNEKYGQESNSGNSGNSGMKMENPSSFQIVIQKLQNCTKLNEDKLDQLNKIKLEFKQENSIVNDEKIKFKNKLKDIQEKHSKLQDRMKFFLMNKTKTKYENVQEQREDLNDNYGPESESGNSRSKMGNPSSLQKVTQKLQKCTTINEETLDQLKKIKSELNQLKDKFSNIHVKVVSILDKSDPDKQNKVDIKTSDCKRSLETERRDKVKGFNELKEIIKSKEEQLATCKTPKSIDDEEPFDNGKEYIKLDCKDTLRMEKTNNLKVFNELKEQIKRKEEELDTCKTSTNSQDFIENSGSNMITYSKTNNISLLTESSLKFLEIVDIVKKEIEISHKKEGEYLNMMKLNLTKTLKEQSNYVSSMISNLIEENSQLKVQSSNLKQTVKNIISEKDILQVNLSNVTQNQIKKEKYVSCLKEVSTEKKKYESIYPIVVNLKEVIKDVKASELYKLLKKFKSCRNLYYFGLQKENSLEAKIRNQKQITDDLSKNVKTFLSNFQKLLQNYFGIKSDFRHAQDSETYKLGRLNEELGNVHKGVRRLYDDFSEKIKTEQNKVLEISGKFQNLKKECIVKENLQDNLETALEVSENYKSHLATKQSHLYKCHVENYKGKKVLKGVYSFYTYLLQRLARLSQGIHHLKVVGSKLRQNLVSVHSTLGHCTGNLQGLRHECQGLVNWYQSMPNMEMTRRKLLTCEEEMKSSGAGLFGPYHQVSDHLLGKLTEQKDEIKRLTEQSGSCKNEKEIVEILETDSSEDEQEIENKYEKSKEYVGKLVAENTHLRLMINKYIQDPQSRADTTEKVYGMLNSVLNGSEQDHDFHMKKYKQLKARLDDIEDKVIFVSEGYNQTSEVKHENLYLQFYQNNSKVCEQKLHHLETHMNDYLTVMKTLKIKKTSEDDQKLKVYQHYVDIIHKSFDLLKERESILISALRKCKDKTDVHHLHFHYPKDQADSELSIRTFGTINKLFPLSDRARQVKKNKNEESTEEFYQPGNVTYEKKRNVEIENIQGLLNDTKTDLARDMTENPVENTELLHPMSVAGFDYSTPAIDIEKIKSILDETG